MVHRKTFATSTTRRSKEGQRGMISALTAATDGSGLFAAGSYRGSIVLYDTRTGRAESELGGCAIGGITQLRFSQDGRFLFSGSRRGSTVTSFTKIEFVIFI